MIGPHPQTAREFRVPSRYPRCRRKRCHQPPVADMRRDHYSLHQGRTVDSWWAYCADHLLEYNREVRDGRVWWRGDAEWHDARLRGQLTPEQAALWPFEEVPRGLQ